MIIHKPRKINQVYKTKYLRAAADDPLGWEEHFEVVKKSTAKGFSVMKKMKSILPQSMLFGVYKALLESHLLYADVI